MGDTGKSDENEIVSIPAAPDGQLWRWPDNKPKVDVFKVLMQHAIDSKYHINWLVYACKFQLQPEMLHYYYVPPATDFEKERPVLHGSPEFKDDMGSKWKITVTFNRWLGLERWMSLYLTRVDKLEFNNCAPNADVQCEFKIVNEEGVVLKALRNTLQNIMHNSTSGFTGFLPFKEVQKMLTKDNCLLVEAHLTILYKAHLFEDVSSKENYMEMEN